MKKIFVILIIIVLISLNSFVTISTKNIDENIYQTIESISLLKDKNELLRLEYDYLTSPSKLEEYQELYFDEKLEVIKIENINEIIVNEDSIQFIKKK